jgi:dTDP-4-dehydrorhamnose 3,5-epimerase
MNGILIWNPAAHEDARGFFSELWKAGVSGRQFGQIEQINISLSKAGVLRGLHLQHNEPMGKAMTVVSGKAHIVAVNCNPLSEDFRRIVELTIDANKPTVFYAGPGWARGFLALEDNTRVMYACTGRYTAGGEIAIEPFSAGVEWPKMDYIVSEKDTTSKTFREHWLEGWYTDTIRWEDLV